MEKSTDINLLCLSQFKLSGAEEGNPVLFKYGDQFNVDVQLTFTLIPNQLLNLANEDNNNKKQLSNKLLVYSSLNYIYIQNGTKFIHTLESYTIDLDSPHLHNALYESNNSFNVDSTTFPIEKDVRSTGHFELSVTWNNDMDSAVRNAGFNIPVPIFEQSALE